jgi:hypothetical protein
MYTVCVSIAVIGAIQGPELLRENPIISSTLNVCVTVSEGTSVVSVMVYGLNVWPGNGFAAEISVGALTLKNPVISPGKVPSPATLQTGV